MAPDDKTSSKSPCRCDQEFDPAAAHRALSRDLATVIDAMARLSAGRSSADALTTDDVRSLETDALSRALRIVGGNETNRFPACCCLGDDARWFCSGTLIRPTVVLTAAHCDVGITRVFAGGTDVSRLDGGEVIDVAAVLRHPEYDPRTNRNDVALLVLANAPSVEPVDIASTAELDAALRCTLVGFGYNDTNRPIGFGIKRELELGITLLQRAQGQDLAQQAAALGFFPDAEFVAGRKALGLDSCNGDSGGPAFIETGDGYKVGGVTSRATLGGDRPCGDGGIYVRPDFYAGWMRRVLGPYGIPF
ncbi:MAG TPA: trypsin-like serine protease [Polyangia bacterium]|nr:trypsin-like serine protease [Polyangia bacterium]